MKISPKKGSDTLSSVSMPRSSPPGGLAVESSLVRAGSAGRHRHQPPAERLPHMVRHDNRLSRRQVEQHGNHLGAGDRLMAVAVEQEMAEAPGLLAQF